MSSYTLADSVTKLTSDTKGKIVVSGSHGGLYATYLACKAGAKAVILNDAGIGRDQAGVGGGEYCQKLEIPYAAVDTMSARIGDAGDQFERGIISYANQKAEFFGVAPGMAVKEALVHLLNTPEIQIDVPVYEESRQVISLPNSTLTLVLIDSASLVEESDKGRIVVAGSHGGLPGPDPAGALRADALIACFNDAGGGIDGAGLTRLPALQDRGIAGLTVGAMSARIGEARSTYEDGIISALNQRASELGGAVGMPLKLFVDQNLT